MENGVSFTMCSFPSSPGPSMIALPRYIFYDRNVRSLVCVVVDEKGSYLHQNRHHILISLKDIINTYVGKTAPPIIPLSNNILQHISPEVFFSIASYEVAPSKVVNYLHM